MPKYRFATYDGKKLDLSPEAFDFPNDEAAAREAQRALADMANENLPDGSHVDMRVAVENEAGKVIYQASLEFNSENASDMRIKRSSPGGGWTTKH